MHTQKKLLLISQVYVPDPAAVGQYMGDAAERMAASSWAVTALTADRCYDNPAIRYPARETIRGVQVRRLPFSSLGKKSLVHRLAGQLSFCLQSFFIVLFTRADALLVTTSPPIGNLLGWAIGLLRPRLRVIYWVMDINPDQAVLLGKVREGSLLAQAMDWLNRRILGRANAIVALDRFMADRLTSKLPAAARRMHILPTWPLEDHLERIEHADNPFRKTHKLEGKRVVMYSGNHAASHPLDTLVQAALRVQDCTNLHFLFIGDGLGRRVVKEAVLQHKPRNITLLPYQPLNELKYSLSAADVHLVAMGNPLVGVVHPCKVYGAMLLAKPILYLGPDKAHIGDIIRRYNCGWQLDHGDTSRAEELLREIAAMDDAALLTAGQRARDGVTTNLSQHYLANRMSAIISGNE